MAALRRGRCQRVRNIERGKEGVSTERDAMEWNAGMEGMDGALGPGLKGWGDGCEQNGRRARRARSWDNLEPRMSRWRKNRLPPLNEPLQHRLWNEQTKANGPANSAGIQNSNEKGLSRAKRSDVLQAVRFWRLFVCNLGWSLGLVVEATKRRIKRVAKKKQWGRVRAKNSRSVNTDKAFEKGSATVVYNITGKSLHTGDGIRRCGRANGVQMEFEGRAGGGERGQPNLDQDVGGCYFGDVDGWATALWPA